LEAARNKEEGQASMGDTERRDAERSEAPRSGGSPILERETPTTPAVRPPDPEVTARHARRRFTTKYKLEILRKADACTQPGQVGELHSAAPPQPNGTEPRVES
jgi:hypothetical protein